MKKKIWFQILSVFTSIALWAGNLSADAASTIFIYQPELPDELRDEH